MPGRLPPLLVALLLAAACATVDKELAGLVSAGQRAEALSRVGGDPERQRALAAIVLADLASEGHEVDAALADLSRAGDVGRLLLEELARRDDGLTATLAAIRLAGTGPSAAELDAWLLDARFAVRGLAANLGAPSLATERLLALTGDPAHEVRLAAITALSGRVPHPPIAPQLVELMMRDPEPRVRAAAARLGRHLGAHAPTELARALDDVNVGVRLAAIEGLGSEASPDSRIRLAELLLSSDAVLALAAATELARLDEERGRSFLATQLTAPGADQRRAALLAATRAALPDDEVWLTAALADPSPEVVLTAAALIDPDQTPLRDATIAALRRLDTGPERLRDEALARRAALEDEAAIPLVTARMTELQEREPELQALIASTRRIPALSPRFVALLADPRPSIRRAAAAAVLATVTP